jgi:hypothetical protein
MPGRPGATGPTTRSAMRLLGGTGEYRTVPEVRALGMYDFPGFMGEARVTDPVPFRISAVKLNDPAGGSQRG